MPQKNSKLKTIKTPIGPIWVYSSVERVIRPLKKKDNLKIITAVGAVIIILLTLLYAGFIDDRKGGKAFSGNGSGTPEDPFQIANCSQLQEMQQSLSSHYALINDIDCSDTVNWNSGAGFVPVGPFSGTLDGRNRTIQNLTVISNVSEVGLFRIVGGVNASVKNLHLYKGVINNTSPSGSNYTGSVTGTLSGGAQIINASSSANLSGLSSTGGIAGQIMNGSISQARYTGAITGNAGSNHNLGGITGLMFQGSINDSYFSGEITHLNTLGIYANRCGGIVGQAANLQKSINRTYSAGTITCNVGMNTVGGIVASANTSNETTISQSYAATKLTSNSAVGAIVGMSNGVGAITHQDNVFDETRSTATNCEGFAAATSCTAINTAGSPAPNYFFGNSSAAPLNSWDFNVVWKTTPGGYPALRTLPSVTTASATDLTQNLATLNGTQWSTLNTATTARGFEWGTDTNYGNTVNLTPSSPSNFTFASKVSATGMNRPQDIAQDADGNIYVTDNRYTTNIVKKYDQDGNLLGTIGNPVDQNWTGTRDGDFNAPNGIAIDTSGNIYVVDTNNNRIQKFAANGTFLTKWGSAGSGDGQFNGPNSLTIDPSGNVYVTDSNNNRVQKFDANGSFITKWGSAGSGNSQFNAPRGITYDFLLDRILVVDTFNARIQEFTTNGAYIAQWGSYGSGNKQFAYPQKIHFSYTGSLYVTDSAGTSPGNQRVQEFITSTRFYLNGWGSNGNGDGEFIFPYGILYNNSNDRIYTVDLYNGRIQIHDDSGNYLSQFGNDAFSAPDGVYVDGLNNMYVQNDQNAPGVQKYDAYGNYQYTIDQDWAQDDIAFDGQNNVYAVGFGGVRKYSPDGELLNTWSFPSSPGASTSIEVDSQGNIYTTDTYNYVQKFDSNFNLIGGWGSYGSGNGQFAYIGDIVIDSLDNIFIIDHDNPRIQKFTTSGTYVTKWGSLGTGNSQFSNSNVNHLAVDSSNNIYVQDAQNHRVQKFTNTGTYITQFGSEGAGDMQFWAPWGIAINSYDQIIIADLGDLSIKTFNQPATFDPESFTSTLSGLTCGTTYHYRSFATNGDGTSYGNDVSFTTSACSSPSPSVTPSPAITPSITTLSATNITDGTADLRGDVTATGGSPITSRGIEYGTDTSYGSTLSESGTNQLSLEDQISSWGTDDGQLQAPHIAIDPNGYMYTIEWYNMRIQKFDPNGNHLLTWGSYGSGPGQFGDPREIATDSAGYVYLVDGLNHRIQKFDSNGNFITAIGGYGSGNGQFSTPFSAIFDESNNMYVADAGNNRVQKFDSNGNYIAQWGNYGTGIGQFYGLTDITYRNGVIATAENEGARVQTFNTSGSPLNQWGNFGTNPGQFTGLDGVAIAEDGSIYTSEWNKRVQKFSSTGTPQLVHNFTEHPEIAALNDIEVGPDGYVYVVNYGGPIVKYAPPGSLIIGNFSLAADSLECGTTYHYRAYATNSSGNGYGNDATFTTESCTPEVTTVDVTNIDDNSATFSGLVSPRWLLAPGFEWSTDPTFATNVDGSETSYSPIYTEAANWGQSGLGQGQLGIPTGIVLDTSDNIYILDQYNCKVSKFDRVGNFVLEWGNCGSASGQFSSPRALAIDSYNDIYVIDTFNHRVQKFDSDGNYLLEWGSEGSGNGQFGYVGARGIAVDSNNNVYVSDGYFDRVQKFDSNGNYLTQWGSTGSGDGQFLIPFRMTTDSNNNVYVTDPELDRVQKFDSNGNYLTQWGSTGSGDGQFAYPTGIRIDSQGNVYVVDPDLNRIQKFDGNGNYLAQWGSMGSGENQFDYVIDIAFDRLDNAYTIDPNLYGSHVKKFSYGFDLTVPDTLTCNTNYYVRAYSTSEGTVSGATGNTLSFTTAPCPGDPPNPPENLRMTSMDGTSVTLVWDAPSYTGGGPITDYLIEFRQAGENDWTPYPNTISTNTYETVTSLSPGVSYFFRTYAVNDYGVSLQSNTVELTYTIDLSLSTSLMNSGPIATGDTVTYRNTLTNNGPGTSTFSDVNVPIAVHVVPAGFNYTGTNSANVACAEAPVASTSAYLSQFYSDAIAVYCFLISPTTLTSGQSLTYDIIGTADSSFVNGATIRGLGINFYEAHRELIEFDDQLTILSGIFMAFGGDFSQPSSSTNVFTLPWNNVTSATYSYATPSSTPSPSPTVTTSTTPSPSPSPSTDPTPSPTPTSTPTNQPEPELPNPLFPKYPPEGVKVPKKDTPPATSQSNFLTGFIPEGVLNTIRMTPNAVALALPFFIILILIALAVLYARQAWLEYRTIANVRGIIERYHSTKEASQNFVALTSHYLNTPVNILQASAELLASTRALSQGNIDKLNLAIKNLAEDIKKLVTESQKTTSRVAESTTELDKLRLKNPLLSVFVIVPSGIVILILFILNLLFTATDRYSLNFALIVAQITALILGIGLLALSWHSYKRNQASRDALKHQLTLEADILARRVAFITQSYSDLNADLGLVKALTKDIPKTDAAQKSLNSGIKMLEDVLTTFGRLINFSRPLETLPAPVSIAPIIDSALKTQKDAIESKKISIESRAPVNLVAPLTQEAAEQLISSLVDNAVKFNKDNGSITIHTKASKRGTKISFTDTGIGIDKTKLSQLMTPFSRATDVLKFDYEGIGLNLYLDKVLLEQIGGELHISSTQGKGTTITLTLPEVKA